MIVPPVVILVDDSYLKIVDDGRDIDDTVGYGGNAD